MTPVTIILLVVLAIVIALLIALYIYGNKMQKKSDSAREQMKIGAQTTSMLVIDKKRIKLKDADLPKIVVEQTPKYLRGSKVPIVKAKIGPKIMSLMCDEKIFDQIPVKKEIKAVMNGIYIMDVKGLRPNLDTPTKKQGFLKNLTSKLKDKASK